MCRCRVGVRHQLMSDTGTHLIREVFVHHSLCRCLEEFIKISFDISIGLVLFE